MGQLPYSDTTAGVALSVVLGVFAVLEWRVALRSRFQHAGSNRDRGSRLVVQVTVLAAMAGAFALAADVPRAAIPGPGLPVFAAGLVLMCGGIAFRQWAVAVLGPLFTTDVRVHAGQQVVDRGPYRWVAHPSYTGMIVTFVGLGLSLENWAALALLAVLPTAGVVVRIRVEEPALVAALGEPYRRFVATRARLVPGVW